MDDLISRQMAVDALSTPHGIMYPIRTIESLPSAQQWIPCSTDFPKKSGDYFVTTHNGQLARYIFNKGASEAYWARCVTAWMPLPKPYIKERSYEFN